MAVKETNHEKNKNLIGGLQTAQTTILHSPEEDDVISLLGVLRRFLYKSDASGPRLRHELSSIWVQGTLKHIHTHTYTFHIHTTEM
jgi:hypothetical protein